MRLPTCICRSTLAIALLLGVAATSPAKATQVSYIDQGQVWVSTLDGAKRRAISGPAPVVAAGEQRAWTEQAQSDDGWIVGVARVSGGTGAAAPTTVWNPAGAVTARSTLGFHGAYNNGGLAVPVRLDLVPGGDQMLYTYSDLVYGYPTSTLHVGTWVTNTSNSSGEPFDIPGLVGASLVGGRWVGINDHAGSADANVVVQSPGGSGPYGTTFMPWFHATGAEAVDVNAAATIAAVLFRLSSSGPTQLALFGTGGLGGAVTASCDVPSSGSVHEVSVAPDGQSLAWTDDRGLVVAAMPPLGSGSPCPLPSAPVVISASGSFPSLGGSTLATNSDGTSSPGAGATPPAGSTAPAGTTSGAGKGGGSMAKLEVTLAKTLKASAFAKGVPIGVVVKGPGKVSASANVGKTVVASSSTKAKKAGKVRLTLRASKARARQLGRYRGKTLTLTIKTPDGTVTLTRKLG